ncbi:OLC1v1011883C1 [Oldenlandia corymbosa var. corymbosa]|uniref:OLC1v1011883C1 n=1 Tax=Oldenlandia corymbosa var. corymbosa TaxID=529605 RepID=A0AAV1DX23_OLDCO|nr:OLC1v1011883C1 [Oldenlandia corymbosa var. corymbosa]
MKSSLGKQLKKLSLHKTSSDVAAKEKKDHSHHQALGHLEALSQASQDMKEMRECCDTLLSAAAATTNSAYEFSESLLEMGNCLLETTALDSDGECGKALSILGNVQLELQKLVDGYRSHVILTITNPSESLLSELRKVEEMKQQCDEKRCIYEHMVAQRGDKGKSKSGKTESTTPQQIQAAREEYDEVARLCVFRVESLKQGQCRSLLTQAARHHAAQLIFFRRGLKSLEAVEPYMRNVAQNQHIDYQLSELDEVEDVQDSSNSDDTSYDGELSFDNIQNSQENDNTGISRNSMELDMNWVDAPVPQISGLDDTEIFGKKKGGDQGINRKGRVSSYSAPLYPDKLDPTERIREVQTSSIQKVHAYALPTPADARNSSNPRTTSSTLHSNIASVSGNSASNLWHSSPLDAEKARRFIDDNLATRSVSKLYSGIKDGDHNNNASIPLPSPLTEGISHPQLDMLNGHDAKKVKRQAFSGPLLSKPSSSKPLISGSGPIGTTELPQAVSGVLLRISTSQPSSTLNASQSVSPPLASSPKISELHELPRPPPPGGSGGKLASSSSAMGHSAPLSNRHREVSPTNRSSVLTSNTGSPLPTPPLTVPRSFSIPSSKHRVAAHVTQLLESHEIKGKAEQLPSPPLTPISMSNLKSATVITELASNLGR